MTHDPFQTYPTLGSYYGMPTPIGLQYPSLQASAINPMAALNPLLGLSPMAQAGGFPQVGQSPYGQNPVQQGLINPQQQLQQVQQLQQLQQLASLLASQVGLQNPLLAASLLSNPLIAAGLHSQALNSPQLGFQQPSLYPQIQQQYPQIGQLGSPFSQIPSPFGQIGYPPAPQSWIGQGGQGFGPVNPFQSQLSQRPFQVQGPSPWGY